MQKKVIPDDIVVLIGEDMEDIFNECISDDGNVAVVIDFDISFGSIFVFLLLFLDFFISICFLLILLVEVVL